jgi:hypothetical protein
LPGERGKPVCLWSGDVDEQIARRGDVRDVEDLINAISRTGMLMPMIDTAAWIPSSTICRLRSMSWRLPMPCTTVESPTAI